MGSQTKNQWRDVCRCGMWAFLALVLGATSAYAQFDRGTISGVVRDSSGSVVPGVSITVMNQQTQVPQVTVSDDSGYYVFANVRPGMYDVRVELQGFKKFERTGQKVDAASTLTINATLEPGNLSETVTVTAESTPLQSDTQVRKTIDTTDIQDLALNGRNPINLALLKTGVRGGTFNSFNPDSLTTGGYNINGSRSDENLITVDGVVATRTRSSGAIVGTQNVDAIDEVQILTSNYLPEYGRASGGQIRFVTKSGGSQFRGSAFEYYRDEKLDANAWNRNRSTLSDQNSGPAPFSYNQFGFNIGGPVMIPGKFNTSRDKMFFFVAEEWIRWRRFDTSINTVPTAKMRSGDFSELLGPNQFFSGPRIVNDPATGQPFPNNIIPPGRLSQQGLALLRTYPDPTAGFQQGANNNIMSSPNPRDTRKDTVRVDYRLSAKNNVSLRYSYFDWKSIDAFRDNLPLARTDWDRPNTTVAASWTSTLRSNLMNEFTYGYALDEVYINVFREGGLFERSKYGINYPYVFKEKEIVDKIPTISISNFRTVDGGPYPASSVGPIHTWSNNVTFLKGRHSFKAGVFIEYSGEDDFDQINVTALPGDTNNQNGRFEFTDGRPGGTGLAMANATMGLFTSYGEIGQRALTKWRGLGTDFFFQDSWKPRDNLTVEYGTRYVIWKPWQALLNNAAMFHPDFYDRASAPVIDRTTGQILSGDRFNGVVLPGAGWPSEARGVVDAASVPEYDRLFRGVPRGFSKTHYNVWEPRFGLSYRLNEQTILRTGAGMFHNRATLNDSTLLGGNAPIQFKIGVQNGLVDAPTGTTPGVFPFLMTMQDPDFKHPTAYNWSLGVQRELPWKIVTTVDYVGRRGLYLQRERNINQLPVGTRFANPGVNVDALRPYPGFSTIRLSENAGKSQYHGLQVSVDRRYTGGLKLGMAYTLSRLKSNADDKRDIIPNTYDDTWYYAVSRLNRTHVFNFHYIYDLPILRNSTSLLGKIVGGWQLSGVTFFQSGEPLSVTRGDDIAGVGDSNGQPWGLVAGQDPTLPRSERGYSQGRTVDQIFWFNPNAFVRPANGTFGNAPRNLIVGPGFQTWDMALLKNFNFGNGRRVQFRAEFFNFPNHPNLNNPNTDPTSADFGRALAKSSERNIQLGVKFYF
jgi:Carboxypeptidase regulatory-like domain/TonB dependent receptor